MIKITKTYTDFNGTERTEDFYFNLSKEELLTQETSVEGGMIGLLRKLVRSNEGEKLTNYFREFVLMSYGEKSEDGRNFFKSPEIRDKFEHHAVFSDIYLDLFEDPKKANDFLKGVFTASLSANFDMGNLENASREDLLKKLEELPEK